jgi:hypothetical protein
MRSSENLCKVNSANFTFHELGAAICVALASTVAAGLTRTPSIDGFTDTFTVFTIAAVAAVLSLRLVPPGK